MTVDSFCTILASKTPNLMPAKKPRKPFSKQSTKCDICLKLSPLETGQKMCCCIYYFPLPVFFMYYKITGRMLNSLFISLCIL